MGDQDRSSKNLLWTIVEGKWVVSTGYRQSSVAIQDPPWFYETMVWEWIPETKSLGAWVGQYSSNNKAPAMKQHYDICASLVEGKVYEP